MQGRQWHIVVVRNVVAFVGRADGVGQSCQTSSSILNVQKIHGVVLVIVIVVWTTLSVVVWCVVGADAAPICSQPKARNALVLAVWGPKSKGSLVLRCRGHQAWFCVVVVGGGGCGGRSVPVGSWCCSGWFLGVRLLMLLPVVVPDLVGEAVR